MEQRSTIRLGTRGSQLAMWQSTWVKDQLERRGCAVELIKIETKGDVTTGSLAQIGGQGLFTKQLQVALQSKQIDLAVHSLKDLPTQDADGLAVTAIPQREVTHDAFVCSRFKRLEDLPAGSVVGTGSVRRSAQLLHLRPDISIKDIRGNLDTRLKKLDDGQYDAIVLAAAGLSRLGWEGRIAHRFPTDQLLPAVGQGALGLETRAADTQTNQVVAQLSHAPSYCAALAERHMLRALFAGCLAPVGALTRPVDDKHLELTGVVLSTDGRERISATCQSTFEDFESLGKQVAAELFDSGAERLLKLAKTS